MTTWSTELPEPRDFANIRLMRVPANGTILGVLTSHEIHGCRTHWDRYRTQPCPGEHDCPLCLAGTPWRWQGWLSLLSQISDRQIVVQVSPLAAQALNEIRQKYGHLRGLLTQFSRATKRPNGRIIVEARQLPKPIENLPPPVDIQHYMEMIWQEKQNFDGKGGAA